METLETKFYRELDKNFAFQIAFFIMLITQQCFQTSETPNKISRYYISNFIRVNLSLLLNVSSTRFGGLMTKFGIFVSENSSYIFQNQTPILEHITKNLQNSERGFKDNNLLAHIKSFSEHLIFNEILLRDLQYLNYNAISKLALSINNQTNTIANYAPAFSLEIKNNIDWTVPMPKPSFKQYRLFDDLVVAGYGLWIPQLADQLKSVGMVLF